MNERRHQQTLELRYTGMRCGPFLKLQDSLHNQWKGRLEQMMCCDILKNDQERTDMHYPGSSATTSPNTLKMSLCVRPGLFSGFLRGKRSE